MDEVVVKDKETMDEGVLPKNSTVDEVVVEDNETVDEGVLLNTDFPSPPPSLRPHCTTTISGRVGFHVIISERTTFKPLFKIIQFEVLTYPNINCCTFLTWN
ncbi:hypothetical protein L2E82_14245 [Cichorium intybus]|uniref:Uncharacterized protein n=1 Tax=Cichorium intybus TaxID=13427 RepID=A0ACB9F027_CICIN|nr:hypothetical protein L2E82_14245 [Cichorium intybus]